jgi:hypothetical protein
MIFALLLAPLATATLAAEVEGADPAQLADGVNRTMQRAPAWCAMP